MADRGILRNAGLRAASRLTILPEHRMLHRVRRDSDEGEWTLQDCRHSAGYRSRREHIRRREILAGWRSNEPDAPSRGSPRLVRPGGSRSGDFLFIVCFVRGVSGMAFGQAGKNNSSGHWRPGMGALRVSTPGGLRELQRAFRSCTDSCCCSCNLHRLGSLANKRYPLSVAGAQMNQSSGLPGPSPKFVKTPTSSPK